MMHHELGAPRTIWAVAIYLCPILCDMYIIVVSPHFMFRVPQEDDNRHSVERTTCTIAKPWDPRSWPWSREPLTYNKYLGTLIKLCTSTWHWNTEHLLDSPKNKMAKDPSHTHANFIKERHISNLFIPCQVVWDRWIRRLSLATSRMQLKGLTRRSKRIRISKKFSDAWLGQSQWSRPATQEMGEGERATRCEWPNSSGMVLQTSAYLQMVLSLANPSRQRVYDAEGLTSERCPPWNVLKRACMV